MRRFRDFLDVLAEFAAGELKRRREDPVGFAEELEDRAKRHRKGGRKRLARIAERRAKNWRDRA